MNNVLINRFASLKNMFTQHNLTFMKDSYSSMMAYNNSKLFNVITAKVNMLSCKFVCDDL